MVTTGAVEDVVVEHDLIVECAVVGHSHKTRGDRPLAFVKLINKPENAEYTDDEKNAIILETKNNVRSELGNWARLCGVIIVTFLPKSRGGKIMRDHLKSIGDGAEFEPLP